MKTVILCGGLGTRLSEETKKIPKPLVKIGKIPILIHIMNIYFKHGYNEFILALGYRSRDIELYFKKKKFKNWKITLVNTGKNTLTGTRIQKLKKHLINDENFFLTYGDGVSNINLRKLLDFHKKKKKVATLTAVRPPARFGELQIIKSSVKEFKEKNQVNAGWINGGFFVFNKKIFNFIPSKKNCMLEREPVNNLVKKRELSAFKHYDFWQCMDTMRDKDLLNNYFKKGKAKWI
tara:strand:+ start:274 stop:978 length:705 start_codon:yes stop_codon:yes gene_type:complete